MMSKFAFVATLVASFALGGWAQKVAAPKYDLAGEVKVKGVVQDVRETPGQFEGTHLVVKTDSATVVVYVGPAEFLKEIDTTFKQGDEIQVVGSKVTDQGQPEILAREITAGTNTFTLRDDKGIPIWQGWKPAKK